MPSLPHPRPHRHRPPGLVAVRVGLPVAILVAAAVVAITGPRGLAPGLVVAAVLVVVADYLIRFAIASQLDRDAEQGARRRFRRTGRWPGDDQDRRDPPRG